jgi:hypothetical protein
MVTHQVRARRKSAEYLLQDVHLYAAREAVRYAGKRVGNDVDKIGYTLSDVCSCLQRLTTAQYQESIQYLDVASWHDVYLISEVGPDGSSRDLYIKFKFFGERLVLSLCSFHPEGWET